MDLLRKVFWSGYQDDQAYNHLKQGKNQKEIRELILDLVESNGFKKRVYIVAATGFFTDAYGLFATNVISPMLAYVYWEPNTDGTHALVINEVTLAGSCIGMLVFGHLADRCGRKALYGVELVIVIIATLGLTQASTGYDHTSAYPGRTPMDIYPWIIFWRFLLGVGIGAEYPLSALIASEWSATKVRGRMLAAVFLMQPVAQLAAYLVGYGALHRISNNWGLNPNETDHDRAAPVIDAVWRCVIGSGSIPAVIAIFARWSIPETPRYLLEIEEGPQRALEAAQWVSGKTIVPQLLTKNENEQELVSNGSAAGGPTGPKVAHEEYYAPVANSTSQSAASHRVASDSTEPKVAHEEYYALVPNSTSQSAPAANPSSSKDIMASGALQEKRQETRIQVEEDSVSEEEVQPKIDTQRTSNGKEERKEKGKKEKEEKGKKEKENARYWNEWNKTYRPKGFLSMLIALSACWFILDICFYGLGLDNPKTIANIWANTAPNTTELRDWRANLASPNETIWNALNGDAQRALYTIPISSILGGVIVLIIINLVPRVTFLAGTFLALAALFLITGGTLIGEYGGSHYSVIIVFYSLSLLVLNLGPNTLIFMLPAELFPTKYRGTCYGIAAASGKLGAIIIQGIIKVSNRLVTNSTQEKLPLGIMLMAFGPLMLLGAAIAWVWIPEVQTTRHTDPTGKEENAHKRTFRDCLPYPNRSLEDIAACPTHEQTFGLSSNVRKQLHLNKSSGNLCDCV